MHYEEFTGALARALEDADLAPTQTATTLNPETLSRVHTLYVEPVGGQTVSEPFFVTAKVEIAWHPLLTARSATTEEDMLREITGNSNVETLPDTERPYLRLDITLRAALPSGRSLSLPSAGTLKSWARELTGRLEAIEPLLPPEIARRGPDDRLEVVGWKGDPRIKAFVTVKGESKLDGASLSAWQSIDLPRVWDDPEREPDEPVDDQLQRLAQRLRSALHAWAEMTHHLRHEG